VHSRYCISTAFRLVFTLFPWLLLLSILQFQSPLQLPEMLLNYCRLLALVAVASASIAQTGQTIQVNGINYFAGPKSVNIIDLTAHGKSSALKGEKIDLVPLTVLGDSTNSFTSDVFTSLVNNYTATDDVFNTGFLRSKYAQ
jgi:hypothetical protein